MGEGRPLVTVGLEPPIEHISLIVEAGRIKVLAMAADERMMLRYEPAVTSRNCK